MRGVGGGGSYVRIRVRMDAQKPLCRGRKIGLDGKRETLLSFKYERLPNFCYWCGLITHSESDCDLWLQSRETLQKKNQQYGPWMRSEGGKNFQRTQTDSARHKTPEEREERSESTPRQTLNPIGEVITRPSRDKKTPWDSNSIQSRVEAPQPVTFRETLQEIDNEIGFIQSEHTRAPTPSSIPQKANGGTAYQQHHEIASELGSGAESSGAAGQIPSIQQTEALSTRRLNEDFGLANTTADQPIPIELDLMEVTVDFEGEKRRKGGQWKKMARGKKKPVQEQDGSLLIHSGNKHTFETVMEEWGPMQIKKKLCSNTERQSMEGDLGSAEVAGQPRRNQ